MNLYQRLMIKNKEAIKEYCKKYPHTAAMIISELKSEEFFTNVRYGTAWDMIRICKLDFLGDAFLDR